MEDNKNLGLEQRTAAPDTIKLRKDTIIAILKALKGIERTLQQALNQ